MGSMGRGPDNKRLLHLRPRIHTPNRRENLPRDIHVGPATGQPLACPAQRCTRNGQYGGFDIR